MKAWIVIPLLVLFLSGCATDPVFRDCVKISDNPVLYKGCKEMR